MKIILNWVYLFYFILFILFFFFWEKRENVRCVLCLTYVRFLPLTIAKCIQVRAWPRRHSVDNVGNTTQGTATASTVSLPRQHVHRPPLCSEVFGEVSRALDCGKALGDSCLGIDSRNDRPIDWCHLWWATNMPEVRTWQNHIGDPARILF